MAASAREIIEGLREEIRRIERRPPARPAFIPSGRPEVDALLPGGGFPRGALVELAGGEASGKTQLALAALSAAMGDEGLAAFVDVRGELYPPAAAALGVDLARLLVVRPCASGSELDGAGWTRALWAAEALLASGAFEAVAIDVPAGDARLRAPGGARLEAMLRRIRGAAEQGGALGLWLGAPGGFRVPSSARLELSPGGPPRVRRAVDRIGATHPGAGVHHAA